MKIRSFITMLLIAPSAWCEPLYYFHVGTQWTYQMDGAKDTIVVNRVEESQVIDGQNWYRLVEYGDSFWVRNAEHGQVEALELYNRDPEILATPDEVLIFKHPAAIGETWNNNGSPTTYLGLQTINVPAGTFTCHKYYIDMGGGHYSLSCIAENVGTVYNESVLDNGRKKTYRLVKRES